MTKGIQALENSLGATLLERRSRGIRPTVLGKSFYRYGEVILSQLERGQAEIARIKGTGSTTLEIGSTPSLLGTILPEILAPLIEKWPKIRVRVKDAHIDNLMPNLVDGELDAVFFGGFEKKSYSSIKSIPLMDTEICFCVNTGHPLARYEKVTLEQLQNCRWIVLDAPDADEFFSALFTKKQLQPPEYVVRSSSLQFLVNIVGVSDLVSFLPHYLIAKGVKEGSLQILRTSEVLASASARIFCRAESLERPEIKSLIELAKKEIEKWTLDMKIDNSS